MGEYPVRDCVWHCVVCNLDRNLCDEIGVGSVGLLVLTQVCVMDICNINLIFGSVCLYIC